MQRTNARWAEDIIVESGGRSWPFLLDTYLRVYHELLAKTDVGRISRRKVLRILREWSTTDGYPLLKEQVRKLPTKDGCVGSLEVLQIVRAFTDGT